MQSRFANYLKRTYFTVSGRASAQEFWHFNVQILLHLALAFVLFACLEALSLSLRDTDRHLPLTISLGVGAFGAHRLCSAPQTNTRNTLDHQSVVDRTAIDLGRQNQRRPVP